LEKKGVLAKIQTTYLLNYWVDLDKIGVILKEIAHECHFYNKILLSSILKALCEDRLASSLVVSLGKTLNGIASTFEWLDW